MFVFTSWSVSFGVSIHIQYFFNVVRNKLQNSKFPLELIKRRSKVQEKTISCERGLNVDQWKKFSKHYKPMRVWLWLVYKFTKNYCRLQLYSKFYLSRENVYPNAKIAGHIKLKFFRLTKLLENLLLVKIGYLEIN